jgi:lipopolysaccharide/colanic/teichoic acid biosynthesis glycosyltransferase
MRNNLQRQLTVLLIRFCDVTLTLLAILFFLPFFLIVIMVLKVTGEGRVFYLQERVGYKGKPFYIIKFVTMLENSPNIGSKELTLPNDPRVLPIGKILRKTKINELPQLLNVLKGDLSLIGPRPQTVHYFKCFNAEDLEFIVNIKPGLSGIGSVFFRNEEELFRGNSDFAVFDEEVIMPYKGRLERWYSENLSIGKYFSLVFLTIYVVIISDELDLLHIFPDLPCPPEQLRK